MKQTRNKRRIIVVGRRLRQIREQRGLTQAELADRVEIHVNQIVRWEKDQSVPSSDALKRLAAELTITADYLLGLVDKPNAHLHENDLSAIEHKLIDAYRRGDLQRLLYELATDEILADKMQERTNVAGNKPATDRQPVEDR